MTKYDSLIQSAVDKFFPELTATFGQNAWLWIKAQIKQESAFDPNAVSHVGAQGLMQIMPATWAWLKAEGDPFDPADSINTGVMYLASLYADFAELPDPLSRLYAALSSYNGGKGYINVSLALARETDKKPFGYRAWIKAGKPYGFWQLYDYWSSFLIHPRCVVRGRKPDARQILGYITHINRHYKGFL